MFHLSFFLHNLESFHCQNQIGKEIFRFFYFLPDLETFRFCFIFLLCLYSTVTIYINFYSVVVRAYLCSAEERVYEPNPWTIFVFSGEVFHSEKFPNQEGNKRSETFPCQFGFDGYISFISWKSFTSFGTV